MVAGVLVLVATGTFIYFCKSNRALERQPPVFHDPAITGHNEAFDPAPHADSAYAMPSSEQQQWYDDANELRRASQSTEHHTYDQVEDALVFNVAGGMAITLYNDGSNSLA